MELPTSICVIDCLYVINCGEFKTSELIEPFCEDQRHIKNDSYDTCYHEKVQKLFELFLLLNV